MSGGREGKGGANLCLRCICWCSCFFFLLISILACLAYYYYNSHKLKAPTYDVQSFVVKTMDIQSDSSIKTEFEVEVKTQNSNKHLGFIYGDNNNVSVLYNDAILSSGKLPAFRQDPGNTTIFKISLSGTSQGDSSTLLDDVNNKKNNDELPLVLKVKVPINVFAGRYDLREVMASVSCDLVVNSLEQGKTAKVLHNECDPDVEF